jgi:hypothetical protein
MLRNKGGIMTTYGILLVDISWSNQDTVEIEKATFLRYKDQLTVGTRALLYMREPVDAVVAEAELTSAIIEHETVTSDSGFNQAGAELAHTYHAPLHVTRLKGQTELITLNRLRTILGGDFSVYDEPWIPLGEAQYRQITALWDKR